MARSVLLRLARLAQLGALTSVGCGLIAGVEDGILAPDAGVGASAVSSAGSDGSPSSSGSGAGGAGTCATIYRDAVLEDGPVGYWRLDDTDPGTAIDSTGNHDGTYEGAVTLSQSGALPDDDAALFAGGSVVVPDAPELDFPLAASFTLEAWVRPDADANGGPKGGVICAKSFYDKVGGGGSDSKGYDGYLWVVMGAPSGAPDAGTDAPPVVYGQLRLHREDSNAPDGLKSDTLQSGGDGGTLEAEQFTHVVTTFDGTKMEARLYFNGKEVGVAAGKVQMPDLVDPFTIGYQDGWGAFRGVIDEVAVYPKVLTVKRIQQHFDAGANCQ